MARAPRTYVLDTNCFIDAARDAVAREAFATFCAQASPGLYLSTVVAAELRAGAGRSRSRLGDTLATLRAHHGLALATASRSFVFDILIAHSCREAGAILISANTRDMERIARVFAFDYVTPYPTHP